MDLKAVVARRVASFRYAASGILFLFRTQVHAWVHLLATMLVLVAGYVFQVSSTEWCLLSLAIGLVWTAETINTSIEAVVDLASPDRHQLAGRAKDVAAGAVLLASVSAAVVGVVVFGPHLLKVLTS